MVPAGSAGVERELVMQIEGSLDETPMAHRALREDRVVEASEELDREVPPRYAKFAGITTLTCAPVAAGGSWFGVIFADRGGGRFSLDAEERRTMLTLGRLSALAASVERSTRQRERAHQLDGRIALIREIHEHVVQRLFGVLLALGSDAELTPEDLRGCHDELQRVLADLRSALGRPVGPPPVPQPRTSLQELVGGMDRLRENLRVDWGGGVEVPEAIEPLAQSVLTEAVRNADKHAPGEPVAVTVRAAQDAFTLEVSSGGPPVPTGRGSGWGLRLLMLEALRHEGLLEYGPAEPAGWRVRLVVPTGAQAQRPPVDRRATMPSTT